MDRRFELYKLLPSGQSEAKPSQEIAKAARITDMRVFRHYIELLRKDGMVICSCSRGLFKPESRSDILHSIYKATIKKFPAPERKDSFEVDGVEYKWMSIPEMEKDDRIQKVNEDVAQLVKECCN